MPSDEFILTLACPEQRGIVHAVSSYLLEHGCDIIDNRQFGDRKIDLHETGSADARAEDGRAEEDRSLVGFSGRRAQRYAQGG